MVEPDNGAISTKWCKAVLADAVLSQLIETNTRPGDSTNFAARNFSDSVANLTNIKACGGAVGIGLLLAGR